MPRCTAFTFWLALLATTAAGHAQVGRYDLGLRLRAFERLLASSPDAGRRAAAFTQLQAAVQSFFGLDTADVARRIDAARWLLLDHRPDPVERFAATLDLRLHRRLVQRGAASVSGELAQAYPAREGDALLELPDGLRAVVTVAGVELASMPIEALPLAFDLPVAALPAGDHALRWTVQTQTAEICARTQSLSVADRLDARLEAAEESLAAAQRQDLEVESGLSLVRLLRVMTRKRGEETLLPGDRLLQEIEALAALAPDEHFYTEVRPGEFWLRVPLARPASRRSERVSLRLLVPAGLERANAVPLVLALHGAGGSENLFFDGYGDGLIVGLCRARGWLLAAPRITLPGAPDLAALVDALAARYPVDRERICVIGHSMGAASATSRGAAFRAVAALGGGGAARADAKATFFVAAGQRDFGRGAAEALHANLQRLGIASRYREYAAVDHLSIVQMALPDVFTFFDEAVAKGRTR